jgi:anti-sigma factor RsiW
MELSEGHVTDKIRACLDGELAPDEAARVRAHCARCRACHRAWTEIENLYRILESDTGAEPLRPVWPGVRERIGEPRRGLARFPFAVGASAAAAAGLLLGLLLGSVGETLGSRAESSWSEVGTLLTDSGTSLDDLYLSGLANGGESQ